MCLWNGYGEGIISWALGAPLLNGSEGFFCLWVVAGRGSGEGLVALFCMQGSCQARLWTKGKAWYPAPGLMSGGYLPYRQHMHNGLPHVPARDVALLSWS